MIIIFIVSFSTLWNKVCCTCPSLCDPTAYSIGNLLCTQPGLVSLPENPAQGITNVTIVNQIFPKPFLAYKNLSKYGLEDIILKHLTIRNCGLRDIESESFSHLIHLTHLDLSENELRSIRPRSFKALNLRILKLDGNKFLNLNKDSLEGLVVNSLSLANCGLEELQFNSIKEISGHLTKLILSGNNLKTLSFRFILLFRRLELLKLDHNLLRCDCHLRWLVGIITKLPGSNDKSTTCYSPQELSGEKIALLPESKFECFVPTLKTVSLNILTSKTATLSCWTTEQSEAMVYWRHKNPKANTKELINNASIHITASDYLDQYSCYAVNDNGNITVDLNIQWPLSFVNITSRPTPSSDTFHKDSRRNGNRNTRYIFLRQFSLWEMLLSIATTFVITIVLFTLIYMFFARKIHFAKYNVSPNRSGFDMPLYSDVYDVPQSRSYYPPSPNSFQSTQLIDFKTQRVITTTHR